MKILMVLVVVLWAGAGWANHLSATIETLECSERNHYCGQTLGHDSPSMPQVDQGDFVTTYTISTGCYASFGSPPRQVEVECQEPQGLPVPVCMKKMEAAMRAMDPFVMVDPKSNIMIVDRHGNYVISPDSYWSGIPSEEAPRRMSAFEQWKAVKRECWSK